MGILGDTIGQIDLGLDVNQASFNKQLSGISKGAENSVSSAFGGLGKKIGIALGGIAVGAFVKDCISLGSDLAEVQNVVDTTFTTMSDSVNKFAINAMEQFGLSETVAKNYMGVLGTMSKSMGFTESQAYDMAEAVTGLAGDVASFYNLSSDEAYTKLKSIWTGETESLKDLGVMLTQTNLDQYALNNGFGKTTANMTEQEKVMLRYQYTLSALGAAQGDFAKTSDSWANQVRVLGLRFDSLKATLGKGFINLFTPVIRLINVLLGKLNVLANAFVKFTELLTGKKTQAAATNVADVADASAGLGTAADSASDLSGAISDAGKSAKKAAKEALGLASFDKINNITDSSSSSGDSSGDSGEGASSGGGAGDGLLNDMSSSVDESTSSMSSAFDALIAKVNELKDVFKTGFEIGFGDSDVKPMFNSIKDIGVQLKGIFTDPEVLSAADRWVTSTVESLGKITGSVASIGVTVGTFLFGSIDSYLKENSDYLKQTIVDLFDISARRGEIYANFMVAVADIFKVFQSPQAIKIGSDLLSIFSTVFLETVKLTGKLSNDILQALTKPIIENKDKIKTALSGVLSNLSIVTDGIKKAVKSIFDNLSKMYDEKLKPTIDTISEAISHVLGTLLELYNKYVAPVIENMSKKLSTFYTSTVAPFVNNVVNLIGSIADAIGTFIKMYVAPFVEYFASVLVPVLAPILETIYNVFIDAISGIIDTISGLIKSIQGILDFVIGVFTGDWEKAWTGIKEFFSGILDSVGGLFEGLFKGITDILVGICKTIVGYFQGAWEGIKVIWNNAKAFFTGIWNGIKDCFTSVGSWFSNIFKLAWEGIKTAWNATGTFFTGIWNGIKGCFSAVGSWFGSAFSGAWSAVKGAFSSVGTFFGSVWTNIKGCFGNVADWFKSTFSKAWKAVKEVFSSGGKVFDGIKDGILNGLKTVINALISGINKVVAIPFNGLNKVLQKIHDTDIMGYKPFKFVKTFTVPQIPKLATGGYVEANTPQLAMIGDNRHQGEVVAPEDKLQSLLDKAVSAGGTGKLEILEIMALLRDILNVLKVIGDKDLIAYITSSELFKSLQKEAKDYKNKTGQPAF